MPPRLLGHLSPQRRRIVLGALALLLALVLLAAAAVVVGRLRDRVRPVPQDRPGPVLLVPGYGGTGASLAPLRDALEGVGRQVVVVSPEGDGRGDLVTQAERLGEVADEVRDAAGAASVDVVGYSAGGVVARLWVAERGGGSVARRVVTLGSPHHGTRVAELGAEVAGGCPEACRQLVPGSDLLRRLEARGETPAGPVWVTVRTEADRVVVPVDSAALTGALNVVVQDLCPGSEVGHPGLPADPTVGAVVLASIGAGPPALPTGAVC